MQEITPKDEIIHKISAACELLASAKIVATEANPLASSVPEINRLGEVTKELNGLMQSISRMRL